MSPEINAYIHAQPEEVQVALRAVYEAMRTVLPEAEERISWQMPTFWQGANLIHFAAQKKHLGIYPGPEAVEAFVPILDAQGWKHSKGAIQLPYDRIDLSLVRELAAFAGRAHGASLDWLGFCGVDCACCEDYTTAKCPGCRRSDWPADDPCPPVGCCQRRGIPYCGG